MMPDDDEEALVGLVERWLERVIIGLSLCPFAAGPHQRRGIRFAVSATGAGAERADLEGALAEVWLEARRLATEEDGAETTLLLLPRGWSSFDDLLDLCAAAEALLERTRLAASVQVVAFHPEFCFAGEAPEDAGNLVNQSPLPLLHLLRVEDVSRAVDGHPDISRIPTENAARLRALGAAAVRALWTTPR